MVQKIESSERERREIPPGFPGSPVPDEFGAAVRHARKAAAFGWSVVLGLVLLVSLGGHMAAEKPVSDSGLVSGQEVAEAKAAYDAAVSELGKTEESRSKLLATVRQEIESLRADLQGKEAVKLSLQTTMAKIREFGGGTQGFPGLTAQLKEVTEKGIPELEARLAEIEAFRQDLVVRADTNAEARRLDARTEEHRARAEVARAALQEARARHAATVADRSKEDAVIRSIATILIASSLAGLVVLLLSTDWSRVLPRSMAASAISAGLAVVYQGGTGALPGFIDKMDPTKIQTPGSFALAVIALSGAAIAWRLSRVLDKAE